MCYDWSTELKLPALLGNFETIQLTDDGRTDGLKGKIHYQ